LKSIEIPSSVVVLGKSSFRGCESLEPLTFESGSRLERIEDSAFSWSGLKSIEIPSSVVVLGKSSFCGCESLESVTFESDSRLERIEESVFVGSGLKSLEIPAGVTFVDGSAFARLSLNYVWVSPDNMRFRVRDCFLEDFGGSTIFRYFGACRSIVIPRSIVVLGKRSFNECKSHESVTFESGSRLERIEESAFSFGGLKSIEIPASVSFIDGSAFAGLSLNSVWVSPENIRFRVRDCFLEDFGGSTICRYFGSYPSIVIPSSVVVFGQWSFHGCKSLESVTFESGPRLERIEDFAFYETGLKSILVPSSVVVLGKRSFHGCKSLESVVFESGSRLDRIEECALSES
jgi:hypothetical protein